MAAELMQLFHNNGHFDFKRTLAQISARFWWYGMSTQVADHVRKCVLCATGKSNGRIPCSPGSLPRHSPFELVFIDLVGPLPSCYGYSFLLTMEDSFTRWVEAVPMTSTTADAVSTAFVKHWVFRLGPPVCIHSDNGPQFECALFAKMCQIFGMKKSRSTPYHPEGNGALERFHRTLKERWLTSSRNWVDSLPAAMFAYRTVPHSQTAMTPFQLTYGFTPQIPQDWPASFSDNKTGYVEQLRAYWSLVRESQGGARVAKAYITCG